MARDLKIYGVSDGRTIFAVAATSRAAALKHMLAAGRNTTVGQMRDYGYTWRRDQVVGTEPIFENAGTVYQKSLNSNAPVWYVVSRNA